MPWREVVAYGFAIGVCQFGLLFLGLKLGMPAGLSSLVIQMQVFFTIGLAVAFAGDHFHRHNLVGAVIAAVGMIVLAAYKLASGLTGTMIGFALVIGAAIAWAAGNIIAKRGAGAHGADMFALTVWSSLVPPLPLAALGFAFEGGPDIFRAVAAMSPLAWGCVLVMSYGATLFGFGSWNALLHRYPTALISPFALLIPVSGLASGALFLGESLAPVQLAGVALVFAGPRLQRLRAAAARAYGARMGSTAMSARRSTRVRLPASITAEVLPCVVYRPTMTGCVQGQARLSPIKDFRMTTILCRSLFLLAACVRIDRRRTGRIPRQDDHVCRPVRGRQRDRPTRPRARSGGHPNREAIGRRRRQARRIGLHRR